MLPRGQRGLRALQEFTSWCRSFVCLLRAVPRRCGVAAWAIVLICAGFGAGRGAFALPGLRGLGASDEPPQTPTW